MWHSRASETRSETEPKKVTGTRAFSNACKKERHHSDFFGVAIYNLQTRELVASFLVPDDKQLRSRIFAIAVKSADLYHRR